MRDATLAAVRFSKSLPWLLAILLLVAALVVLATVQWRWVDEVTRAQRSELERLLHVSAEQFARGFDDEVDDLIAAIHPRPEEMRVPLGERMKEWRARAQYPEMVGSIYRVTPQPDTPLQVEKVGAGGDMTPEPDASRSDALMALLPRGPHPPVIVDARAAAIVATLPPLPGEEGPPELRPPPTFIVVFLDREALRTRIFPTMLARTFGEHLAVDVQVTTADGEVVFGPPNYSRAADVVQPFFRIRNGARAYSPSPRPFEQPDPRFPRRGGRAMSPPSEGWQLRVFNREGSFDDVIARTRMRHLVTAGAILLVLAVAFLMTLLLARRTALAAQQQLAFIAGITHELNTPVAAISTAGQNLADGVVTDPERVRQYGTMLTREAQRLSAQVAQVLAFARLDVRPLIPNESFALAAAVDDAMKHLDLTSFEVTSALDRNVFVRGDRGAISRVASNLLTNAMKYSSTTKAIDVQLRREGDDAVLTVADRGVGIAPSDQPRVFEPFFRGRHIASNIPGSGLGLNLVRGIVRAHGGEAKIVSSTPGQGTIVEVRLPAVERAS